MVRIIFVFFVFALLVHICITGWRSLSNLERWSLTKSIGYSILVSAIAGMVLTGIVILF
jgi:hypothetical protein